MKLRFLFLAVLLFFPIACSSPWPLFTGDPSAPLGTSLSSLPEGQEIRTNGVLEKHFEKTGSYAYTLNGTWLTFDDDRVIVDDFVGKTVTVKGTVHHFNNCPPKQDPEMPQQCLIAEQLRVIDMR